MKIKHLRVNGFGKLKDKEIDFKDGINVIYGENEAGKSTLLKFISCMFYGTSRNKNGRSISDFDRFKPWKTEEYSGTVDYKLDSREEYSVYREFKRKNPTVYNSEKEDITKNFKEDRTGVNFFTEQTGIDEKTYFNTAISEQTELALSLSNQNSLIQRISNFVLAGNDNISYQKSMLQITKLQNENVGTERTSLKPLNFVNTRIESAMSRKKELDELKNNCKDDSLENEKLSFKLKSNEKKLSFLKKVKEFHENNRLKMAEINFNKNVAIEDDERIKELIDKLENLENDEILKKKLNKTPYIVLIAFLIIIAIAVFAIFNKAIGFIPSIFASGFSLVLASVVAIVMIVKSNKLKNNEAKELLSKKSKLKFELDNLKEKNRKKESEIKNKNQKIELEIDTEKDSLINEYLKVLDINFIDEVLSKTYEDVLSQIEIFEKKISNIKLDIKELEITKKAYNSKLEELARIEEELNSAQEEKEELLSLNKSYNIAKECLELAYEETKKNISPKFTKNLCDIISKISCGKYNNVALNDEDGIIVELENGSYVPIERLSIGTIDQMYLSLRLSSIKEVSNESMPIILDEAFAYFDNTRLENMIKYLEENYKDNQILIFTCSNREKDILNKLNIEYNLINLEK